MSKNHPGDSGQCFPADPDRIRIGPGMVTLFRHLLGSGSVPIPPRRPSSGEGGDGMVYIYIYMCVCESMCKGGFVSRFGLAVRC